MDDTAGADREHLISVQLDVDLGHEPVRGRLRSGAADEPFVGWLGFFDALRRLAAPADHRPPTPDPTT